MDAVMFCPRCGTRRQPQMGFCTRCGANLAELEDAIRRGLAEGSGVHLVTRGGGARPVAAPPPTTPADQALTEALPKVRRPQAESREERPAGSSLWHPDADATERIGPVQFGGARAPWLRRVGAREGGRWLRPLALLGGVMALGSAFLPWIQWNFDFTAFRFPVQFLVTGEPGRRTVSVGLLLVILGGVALLLTPIRRLSLLRRALGLLVFAIAALFATTGLAPKDAAQLFHDLGPGVYVAAVGGLLLLFG
jgi:hypothetical protein